MILARLFQFTADLETQLATERAKIAGLEAGALRDRQELDRLEQGHVYLTELREELSTEQCLRAAAEAVRDDHLAQIERLTEQVAGLNDRLCLRSNTVPLSEPLKNPHVTEAGKEPGDLKEMLDRTVRRSGPVAAARQAAEEEDELRQLDELERRRRLGARAGITRAPLVDDDETSDVMQHSANASA